MDVTSPVSVRTVSLACTDATKGMSLHENQKRLRFYQNLVLPAFFCWCGKFTRRFCLLTGAQHSRLHPQSVLWLLIPKILFVARSQSVPPQKTTTLLLHWSFREEKPLLAPLWDPSTPHNLHPSFQILTIMDLPVVQSTHQDPLQQSWSLEDLIPQAHLTQGAHTHPVQFPLFLP